MRCFGWFNDNELCDMCREVLTRKYDKCKQTYKDKINKQKELKINCIRQYHAGRKTPEEIEGIISDLKQESYNYRRSIPFYQK